MKTLLPLAILVMAAFACVPKTQFIEQEEELKDAQAKIKALEATKSECDPNTLAELREQTQSLDILQQELVDRNTELAEEVARLRAYESQVKSGNLSCESKLNALERDYEGRLLRTKATYEDLIQDYKAQIAEKNAELATYKKASEAKKPAKKKKSAPRNSRSGEQKN